MAPQGNKLLGKEWFADETKRFEGFCVQIPKAKNTDVGSAYADHDWTKFMQKRKTLLLDDKVNERKVPEGNLPLDELAPTVEQAQAQTETAKARIKSKEELEHFDDDAEMRLIRRTQGAIRICVYIIEHRSQLIAKWGPNRERKDNNGYANFIPKPQSSQKTSNQFDENNEHAKEFYLRRFAEPHWHELYELVKSYYLILWPVVKPSEVNAIQSSVGGQVSSEADALIPKILAIARSASFAKLFSDDEKWPAWKASAFSRYAIGRLQGLVSDFEKEFESEEALIEEAQAQVQSDDESITSLRDEPPHPSPKKRKRNESEGQSPKKTKSTGSASKPTRANPSRK